MDDPPPTAVEFQRTLALIKPNAISKSKAIEEMIEKSGLLILNRRRMYLKPEQARDYYIRSIEDEDSVRYYKLYEDMVKSTAAERGSKEPPLPAINISGGATAGESSSKTSSMMDEYVDFMTSGPVEVMVLAGRGAVSKLARLMGPENPKIARETHPESIRAKFGGETILRNAIHGSDSVSRAEKEIKFFFPGSKFDMECKIGTSGEYLSKTVNPILLKGLIQLCRQKPENPLVWLADWLLANNPNAKP